MIMRILNIWCVDDIEYPKDSPKSFTNVQSYKICDSFCWVTNFRLFEHTLAIYPIPKIEKILLLLKLNLFLNKLEILRCRNEVNFKSQLLRQWIYINVKLLYRRYSSLLLFNIKIRDQKLIWNVLFLCLIIHIYIYRIFY